jgi:two-component system phosphate regulon sensor histidine kinase PhoR
MSDDEIDKSAVLSQQSSTASPAAAARALEGASFLPDFDETLKRLIARIARILQANKCVFLLYDPSTDELQALPPALGLTYDQLGEIHVKATEETVPGKVFLSGSPVIVDNRPGVVSVSPSLPDSVKITNGVCVPLIVEKRDENNRVVERNTIGVLFVLNKSMGQQFSNDDVTLLTRMSSSAASILTSARDFLAAMQESQGIINTIESFSLGLVVVGLNGRILQINSAARSVLCLSDNVPVYGAPVSIVVKHLALNELIQNALNDGKPQERSSEITLPAPPGGGVDAPKERIYQAQCAPALGSDGKEVIGLAILLNDITEIRNVERMKTAFISTVSHELRTPLTSIKGFIETLLSDTDGFYDHETQLEFFRIINTECDRLTRLIEDLLNVSRIEQGKAMQLNLELVDFTVVAEKVLSTQRAYTKPDRHQLSASFEDGFPLVEADKDKIDQILTNLVSNAIKYSPKGGEIRIIGKRINGGSRIEVRVEDQGMGIPREHLAKVWERFHRVDNRDNREIGGTGIGLFLVKSLVEAHAGEVGIESEYGSGSTFLFRMPIHQPASPPAV